MQKRLLPAAILGLVLVATTAVAQPGYDDRRPPPPPHSRYHHYRRHYMHRPPPPPPPRYDHGPGGPR